jgi:hypothetical protein
MDAWSDYLNAGDLNGMEIQIKQSEKYDWVYLIKITQYITVINTNVLFFQMYLVHLS